MRYLVVTENGYRIEFYGLQSHNLNTLNDINLNFKGKMNLLAICKLLKTSFGDLQNVSIYINGIFYKVRK